MDFLATVTLGEMLILLLMFSGLLWTIERVRTFMLFQELRKKVLKGEIKISNVETQHSKKKRPSDGNNKEEK